jgi:hypothetical protein
LSPFKERFLPVLCLTGQRANGPTGATYHQVIQYGVEMVIEMLKHWAVAVDGIQIFLCLLILFFLIRNHRPKMKTDLMNHESQSDQNFNLQVFSQTINQQIELAFANILEVAANERRNLDQVLQFHQFNLPDGNPAGPNSDDTLQRVNDSAGQGQRQARIQRLATRGMSAKQISEKLKTPMGEVELILSLQNHGQN